MKRLFILMGLISVCLVLGGLFGDAKVLAGAKKNYIVEFKVEEPTKIELTQADIEEAFTLIKSDLSEVNAKVLQTYSNVPFAAIELDESKVDELLSGGDIVAIEESSVYEVFLSDVNKIVNSQAVHSSGYHGQGSVVVVIDTGAAVDHPFYEVIDGACFSNTPNRADRSSSCPSGSTVQKGAAAGAGCYVYASACEHGTHVSGIVAGRTTNLRGLAPKAKIITINASSFVTGLACGTSSAVAKCASFTTEDIIASLDYVVELKAKWAKQGLNVSVVNMSLGGGKYLTQASCHSVNGVTRSAIARLSSLGVTTVAAAGNNGYEDAISSPGCIQESISVGASDNNDKIATFSNVSPFLDVFAPGVGIDSAYPFGNSKILSNKRFQYYIRQQGTSMAAPAVAGIVSVMKQANPALTTNQIKAILAKTGKPVRASDMHDSFPVKTSPVKRVDFAAAIKDIVGTKKIGGDTSFTDQGVNQCRKSHILNTRATTKVSLPKFNEKYVAYVRVKHPDNISGQIIGDLYESGKPFGHSTMCGLSAADYTYSDETKDKWRWVIMSMPDIMTRQETEALKYDELTLYFGAAFANKGSVDSIVIRNGLCNPLGSIDGQGICLDEEFERSPYFDVTEPNRFKVDPSAHNEAYTEFGDAVPVQAITSSDVLGAFDDNGNISYNSEGPIKNSAIILPFTTIAIIAALGGVLMVTIVIITTHSKLKTHKVPITVISVFMVVGIATLAITNAGAPPVTRVEFEDFDSLPSSSKIEIDASANGGSSVKFN